ncbi:hypothetical protein Desdi_0376 [Desulfitobacterium dichloroeliminans LMG P-21439]|uniref:Uncharacterized protein n=1 Tax=Desulfitobacterium dichloroeliminans (strain LMG P-21439 / DCA1) TaxID=871963 RepID=L0F424_DESDL|nr:hypothetical protein [Desulfitobacterium dichloroeliminans]AGA67922.1 hypothetical protein Desdi_0376 [Desulfitobacterium dichloroeliminans LMG P-21439]
MKKYIMLKPEEEAVAAAASTLEFMVYFGENSTNYRFPEIEVNDDNQAKLQKLVNDYHALIKKENDKDLDLKTFLAEKQIKIENVDEFEEPRDMFILLTYFKEVCTLDDFAPLAVVEKL